MAPFDIAIAAQHVAHCSRSPEKCRRCERYLFESSEAVSHQVMAHAEVLVTLDYLEAA